MKLLIVTHNISAGGAATACRRLIAAFNSQEINLEILTIKEREFSNLVIGKGYRIYSVLLSKLDMKICKFLSNGSPHWQSSGLIGVLKARKIRILKPDAVNIHWIGHATISIRQIKKIDFPIIITMHDEWWLNIINHYQTATEFHKKSFIRNALLYYILKEKNQLLKLPNVTIVSPSKELKNKFINRIEEKNNQFHVIPNPTSVKIFHPMSNIQAKTKTILFAGGTQDRRKGYDLLVQTLSLMKEECQVIVLGESGTLLSGVNNQIRIVGSPWMNSEVEMNRMYNEVQITIVPSRQEAFGLVASESMMAGTPVASFSVGGLNDIVLNGFNGFTVDNLDTKEMAERLDGFLRSNSYDNFQISENAKLRFSEESVVRAYFDILEKY